MKALRDITWLEYTEALSQVPYAPGIVSSLNIYTEKPQSTTTVNVEIDGATLALVPSVPRGSPPDVNVGGQRRIHSMRIPHFPLSDTILADEVQDVRSFGSATGLQSFPLVVQDRLLAMGTKLDVTLEHLRLGGTRGVIVTRLNRDSGAIEQSISLFNLFGVTPPAPVDFTFDVTPDSAWSGSTTTTINTIINAIEDELAASPPGIVALCGRDFWNAFITSSEVRDAYRFSEAGTMLAAPASGSPIGNPQPAPSGIMYRGVRFIRYVGKIGNYQFLPADEAAFFPVGVPGLFVEAYAPADYRETVNTVALPRYAKTETMDFGRGDMLEVQMNVLPICTKPKVLIPASFVMATGGAAAAARTPAPAPARARAG